MKTTFLSFEEILPVPLFQWRYSHASKEGIKKSLEELGFISPLIGYLEGNQFFLIDGYERLSFAKDLQINNIPVCILDTDLAKAFQIRLILNSNMWNSMELSNILNTASTLLSPSEVALKISPLINIKSSHLIKEYIKLRELPILIKQLYGQCPLPVLQKFLDFTIQEQEILATFFSNFIVNQNKLNEMLELFQEVNHITQKPLGDIIHILLNESAAISTPDKIETIRHQLKMLRNPRFEAQKNEWELIKKKLRGDSSINLETSPFFEGDDIIVQARVKSPSDLIKIREILAKSEWEQALKIIKA